MMDLKRLLKRSWGRFKEEEIFLPKSSGWIYFALGLAGFIDATYLSVKTLTGGGVKCFVGQNCDKVLLSPFAHLFGLPVSLLGAVFYLAVFLSAVYWLEAENKAIFKIIFPLTWLGFLFSIYLLSVQAFVLKSFCSYCVVSAVIASSLFIYSVYLCSKDFPAEE